MVDILIIIGLILLNALFSMSEIAVISARKTSLQSEAKRGNKRAKAALKLTNDPNRFLSTVQIGITLIGILTGMYSGEAFASGFSVLFIEIGIAPTYAFVIAKTIIVLVVTYLTIVFGELVPKRVGMSAAERVAKAVAHPMHLLSVVVSPFVWLLSKSTTVIFNLLGVNTEDNKVTEEEIKSLIQEGFEGGEVQPVEQYIVDRVFSLGDRDLESIMTHHSDIVWIDLDMTIDEIRSFVIEHPEDLYPVAYKKIDSAIGIIYVRDLFGNIDKSGFKIEDIICPVPYFPENMDVYQALEQMKLKRIQYAFVCDEFGSINGIVDMKDVLEALVGELPDSHEDPDIVVREDGSCLVDGQCSFYDFLSYFKMGNLYEEYDYNTLSGLILDILEHVPQTGEKLKWKNFSLEIVDMDGTRIDKVLVTYNNPDVEFNI